MSETISDNRGILYFAKGDTFVREAIISAQRVKEVMPEYPITLIADREVEAEWFDEVLLDRTEFEWADTPAALARSPYERTIFLDVDTYLEDTIAELFDLLDGFEFGARINRDRAHIPDAPDDELVDGVPSGLPEISSGVLAYRDTPAVAEMLDDWERRGRADGAPDQRSLRAALYHSNVQFTPLEHRYNCLYRSDNTVDGSVKVFHGALTKRDRNQVNLDHARKVLNTSEEFRIHRRYRSTLFLDPPLPTSYRISVLARRVKEIHHNRGLKGVVLKTGRKISRSLR